MRFFSTERLSVRPTLSSSSRGSSSAQLSNKPDTNPCIGSEGIGAREATYLPNETTGTLIASFEAQIRQLTRLHRRDRQQRFWSTVWEGYQSIECMLIEARLRDSLNSGKKKAQKT
mmetsp:Transcript_3159/g.14668  ORF Transcript_3159/g.14668 Transcript_3159/m.14668 type:complete len:116 (-) Transcript_3159:1642-1989(-)